MISCFLVSFRGQLQDGGKGGEYMRKRFEAATHTQKERERERKRNAIREKQMEGE